MTECWVYPCPLCDLGRYLFNCCGSLFSHVSNYLPVWAVVNFGASVTKFVIKGWLSEPVFSGG